MMRPFPLTVVLASALALLAAAEPEKFALPAPGPDGAIAIFNGKDLSGWYGDETVWKAQDGQIVGKTETGLKLNNFLKSKFEVADFRLVIQVKLVPANTNSGIQFRSVPFKGHEMKGYQADVGKGWWGKLYEESARGMLVKDGAEDVVKPEEWNTYEIVAVGHRVLMALNGKKCVDFDDPKGDLNGILALQVHSGGPTEVRFRDLKLYLNPKAELVTVK